MTLPIELPGFRLLDGNDINNIVSYLKGPQASITTADTGATQTLTAAMVAVPGSPEVYHTSASGSTPTLTMPTAAAILALLPDIAVGSSWYLRFINTNSGTATLATNTGITTSGTLTLLTNTTRDFIMSVTSIANPAITMTSVGTGTTS